MTPLPNLPTDNLYKFVFVAGLTIILSSAIIFVTQHNIISTEIDNVELEIIKLEKESDFLTDDTNLLETEINSQFGLFYQDLQK